MPTRASAVVQSLFHFSRTLSSKPTTARISSRQPIRKFSIMDNVVNFYSGQPPLNRVSFQRSDASKLNGYLPRAKFMLFLKGNPLVEAGKIGTPLFLDYAQVEQYLAGGYQSVPESVTDARAKKAYESIRLPNTLPTLLFLGIDERLAPKGEDLHAPTGVPYFALDASAIGLDLASVNGEWGDARASGAMMPAWEAGLFAFARPLIDWNFRHKFCQACGAQTYSLWGGWKRNCITSVEPVEGKTCFSTTGLHNFAYPRTDPVIIMGILDSTGDKMLLGRQKAWPKGMYSCLAGFIEPGESFEEAVRREVLEEAGIEVGPVRYGSSQPWPYPANLMVGFYGRAQEGQQIRLDLDNELEDAQFFPREVVAAICNSASGSKFTKDDYKQLDNVTKGKVDESAPADDYAHFTRVPPETAIAGVLMRQWALGQHAMHLVSKI